MAAVAPLPAVPYAVLSAPNMAQKRRLDGECAVVNKMAKVAPPEAIVSVPSLPPLAASLPVPLATARPIVTVRRTTNAKRPQMKYDPSVPMTKEETSAWRREQRRKRNRESAAACRRRQRDRISELEVEVAGWKAKFDDALSKLGEAEGDDAAAELKKEMEAMFVLKEPKTEAQVGSERCSTPPSLAPEATLSMTVPVQGQRQSHVVSPVDRPKFIPPYVTSSSNEDLGFPVLEDSLLKTSSPKAHLSGSVVPSDSLNPRVENRAHLTELISRPAVKITGALDPPLANIESVCDDLLQVVPDSCLSLTEKKTMPFPEACPSLVPQGDVSGSDSVGPATAAVSAVTTDESDEDSDLGEFLADAVNWL